MDPSGADELERTRRQLVRFADDLRSMLDQERELRREAQEAYRALQGSYTRMVRTLAETCEAKDTYTRGHLDRTYQYAMLLLAREAPEFVRRAEIGYGFLLHDIGKVGIPEAVLNKPGPLSEDEWAIMRTHPIIGEEIVRPLEFLGDAVRIVRSHHERWDGGGYPEGLAGQDTFLPARVFMLADTFDAMTTDRPYRKALPIDVVLEEIDRHAGTQFDPDLAASWIELVRERERRGDDVTLA